MRNSELPPGTAFEHEVANYYRLCGAQTVRVNVELAGNQIDVYVEEETPSGLLVRTVVECKDHGSSIGVKLINEFAQVFQLIRSAKFAEKAVFVSAKGYSVQARKAAESFGIEAVTAADIRSQVKAIENIESLAVWEPESFFSLQRRGRVLGYRRRILSPRSASEEADLISDPNLVLKVKLMADYIREIERLSADPVGKIVSVDISGSATWFSNWIYNPLYVALLQANAHYVRAFRKRHGLSRMAALRSFIVDPAVLSSELIGNIEGTLRNHLRSGIATGVIFKGSQLPGDVIADIADLAERLCVDYGRLEGFGESEAAVLDIIARPSDPQFNRIRERVAWATETKNIDVVLRKEEQVAEFVRELKKRARLAH